MTLLFPDQPEKGCKQDHDDGGVFHDGIMVPFLRVCG
jgi:hypothetical protein